MAPWEMPDPLLPVAIVAHSQGRRGQARRQGLRPAGRRGPDACGWSATPRPTSWCCGAWARRTSTCCSTGCATATASRSTPMPLRVSLRETFAGRGQGHGRHVKQSGGHGQFAVCDIEVEPLPPGAGFEFVDKVVGGAVPRQFIPSVEKGVRAQMERGVAAGYPVVDIRVTLVDGKAHWVDSSDMAFQTAGGAGAARRPPRRRPSTCSSRSTRSPSWSSDEYVGAVMSDLSGRRGRVAGTEPAGERAHAGPGRGARRSRSPGTPSTCARCSHGTGTFTRAYVRHEPMPTADRGQGAGGGAPSTLTPRRSSEHVRRAPRPDATGTYARPLDVPAMARRRPECRRSHFSRQFRAAYGETPYGYLMIRRIERAKALLRARRPVGDRRVHGGRLHVAGRRSAPGSPRSSASRPAPTGRGDHSGARRRPVRCVATVVEQAGHERAGTEKPAAGQAPSVVP